MCCTRAACACKADDMPRQPPRAPHRQTHLPPLPRSVLATVQEGGDKASFLHVWQSSYCDNETARNSMESIDVFLE